MQKSDNKESNVTNLMSEDQAFKTQLDLKSQNVLINLLADTVKENERLTLVNQDSSAGNTETHLQTIHNQIEEQKKRLEALNKSNEEILKETENARQLFLKKTQNVKNSYEKLVEEKIELRMSKNMKLHQFQSEIEGLENEEKALDDEIQQLCDHIERVKSINIETRAGGTWSSNIQNVIDGAHNLLNITEPLYDCYSDIVDFHEDHFCKRVEKETPPPPPPPPPEKPEPEKRERQPIVVQKTATQPTVYKPSVIIQPPAKTHVQQIQAPLPPQPLQQPTYIKAPEKPIYQYQPIPADQNYIIRQQMQMQSQKDVTMQQPRVAMQPPIMIADRTKKVPQEMQQVSYAQYQRPIQDPQAFQMQMYQEQIQRASIPIPDPSGIPNYPMPVTIPGYQIMYQFAPQYKPGQPQMMQQLPPNVIAQQQPMNQMPVRITRITNPRK